MQSWEIHLTGVTLEYCMCGKYGKYEATSNKTVSLAEEQGKELAWLCMEVTK